MNKFSNNNHLNTGVFFFMIVALFNRIRYTHTDSENKQPKNWERNQILPNNFSNSAEQIYC